jgi:hypothetical protein
MTQRSVLGQIVVLQLGGLDDLRHLDLSAIKVSRLARLALHVLHDLVAVVGCPAGLATSLGGVLLASVFGGGVDALAGDGGLDGRGSLDGLSGRAACSGQGSFDGEDG